MARTVNLGQIVPNIQIGETTTTPPSSSASVVNVGTELNPILNFSIPQGSAGADAKINGVNTLTIEAGDNITLDQEGSTLTINSTGGSGGTSDYTDLTNKPSINNVTLSGNKSLNDLGIQPKGNYALESDIPDVSDFITNTVDDLVNYYKKTETFTKQEVNNLISAITTMDIQVVQTLPVQDISTTTIYLVPKTTAETNDAYDEYIYVSNAWEHIGSTEVDLTNYVKNTDYATAEKGGTIRTSNASGLGISNGNLYAVTKSYNIYNSASGNMFIGKGTLENVLIGKGLVSNIDYATYSNGGVIKVDGAFSTFITDGKLKCTLKTYGDYQNLSSYAFIGKGTLENVVAGKNLESANNKTTTISSSSTDNEYPSAKAVYDYIQSLNGDEVNY